MIFNHRDNLMIMVTRNEYLQRQISDLITQLRSRPVIKVGRSRLRPDGFVIAITEVDYEISPYSPIEIYAVTARKRSGLPMYKLTVVNEEMTFTACGQLDDQLKNTLEELPTGIAGLLEGHLMFLRGRSTVYYGYWNLDYFLQIV